MEIKGIPSNTKNQKECSENLLTNRDWVDNEIQKHLDNSSLPVEIKKLVAEVASSIILYSQENASAVFNYSSSDEK